MYNRKKSCIWTFRFYFKFSLQTSSNGCAKPLHSNNFLFKPITNKRHSFIILHAHLDRFSWVLISILTQKVKTNCCWITDSLLGFLKIEFSISISFDMNQFESNFSFIYQPFGLADHQNHFRYDNHVLFNFKIILYDFTFVLIDFKIAAKKRKKNWRILVVPKTTWKRRVAGFGFCIVLFMVNFIT